MVSNIANILTGSKERKVTPTTSSAPLEKEREKKKQRKKFEPEILVSKMTFSSSFQL